MPSKKKKYNARFPAGRIKKIMQTDEEVGKVAQAVPVIISRTLELFVESLLTKSMQITQARSAKTLTPSHMKQCILSESRFDFLKDLVKNVPDPSVQEDNENNAANECVSLTEDVPSSKIVEQKPNEIVANFYTEQGTSSTAAGRTPVIQYGRRAAQTTEQPPKLNFSIENIVNHKTETITTEPKFHIDLSNVPIAITPSSSSSSTSLSPSSSTQVVGNSSHLTHHNVPVTSPNDNIPPLIPIAHNNLYSQTNSSDNNLYIDEDYDN